MVFCCIAIVGIALLYVTFLWMRQLFLRPLRDRSHPSQLPAPPRALFSGHGGSIPVYGHTFLFQQMAGGCALLFDPQKTKEINFLPAFDFGKGMICNRRLGECFAIYIWGQWRVCVQGPERTKQVLDSMDLKDAFPWTPPVTLLGKSCLSFLDDSDAEQLRMLIERPLSYRMLQMQYARIFAQLAEQCLEDIVNGKFAKHHHHNPKQTSEKDKAPSKSRRKHTNEITAMFSSTDNDDIDDLECARPGLHRGQMDASGSHDSDLSSLHGNDSVLKVKWDALRSFSFDLINGPILNFDKWTSHELTKEESESKTSDANEELPTRDKMLRYMERMKTGIDVIKLTFGPEWMYIWMLNEYGRALNARMHVQAIVSQHVEKMQVLVPAVEHKPGHIHHDPTTQLIPILTLRENLIRDREGIFGHLPKTGSMLPAAGRPRSYSAPVVITNQHQTDSDAENDTPTAPTTVNGTAPCAKSRDFVSPFTTEQDLARPRYENSPALCDKNRKHAVPIIEEAPGNMSPSCRQFRKEMLENPPPAPRSAAKPMPKKAGIGAKEKFVPLLERLLRQQDLDGNGLSQAVLSELSIILWMMLDVGNAWTTMALNLLAQDKDACELVQAELDELASQFNRDDLFSPSVLNRMTYVDALIYEAIRLTPSFLGGLKQTTRTIEFKEDGVQLPKNTHVFFCQPTSDPFDIRGAAGKKPEHLGSNYPCVELHGFLPLQGLEVPLMVLQTKIFLVVTLQKYTPLLSKKRTLLRRVKVAVNRSIRDMRTRIGSESAAPGEAPLARPTSNLRSSSTASTSRLSSDQPGNSSTDAPKAVSQRQAMEMFTKLPFPEPRRVTYLRPREWDSTFPASAE